MSILTEKEHCRILKLTTPRLLAWFKSHRRDGEPLDGYGLDVLSEEQIAEHNAEAALEQVFLDAVKVELNTREHV